MENELFFSMSKSTLAHIRQYVRCRGSKCRFHIIVTALEIEQNKLSVQVKNNSLVKYDFFCVIFLKLRVLSKMSI